MNEQQWLSSTNTRDMLRLATGRISRCCGCVWCDHNDGTVSMAYGQKCCNLCDNDRPVAGYQCIASDRKLRLFAVALCRRMWHLLGTHARTLVNIVERKAEGESFSISQESIEFQEWVSDTNTITTYDIPAINCALPNSYDAVIACSESSRIVMAIPDYIQANILRDIVGNPYRQARIEEKVLDIAGQTACWPYRKANWITPVTTGIARSIYEDRAFDRLPILADALEEAGCEDMDILLHCRGEERCTHCLCGPNRKKCTQCFEGVTSRRGSGHDLGCFVLDIILEKE